MFSYIFCKHVPIQGASKVDVRLMCAGARVRMRVPVGGFLSLSPFCIEHFTTGCNKMGMRRQIPIPQRLLLTLSGAYTHSPLPCIRREWNANMGRNKPRTFFVNFWW